MKKTNTPAADKAATATAAKKNLRQMILAHHPASCRAIQVAATAATIITNSNLAA